MATPELKPVYLITGSDRPKVEYAVRRLRQRFDQTAVDIVSAVDTDSETVVALCNAGTLFGDRRLVIVREVDGRRDASNRLGKGWKPAAIEGVVTYLSSPAPDTVLCLVAEEVKKDSVLGKACTRAGTVLDFFVIKRQLSSWVAERFRQLGIEADGEACGALLHIVGDDLHALQTEIEKIATWADGQPVGAREVEALAVPNADVPGFALTDAWARRDGAKALGAMETLYERSDQQRRSESARIAGTLGGHLVRLRQLKRAGAEGKRAREVAGSLRMHPYYAEKVFTQAEGFSDEELDEATVVLAVLDHALKGGSRLASDLEVQRAIALLTRAPGR
ncbi:MAG: DNA polymerase III subunit delta [Gaiella sp.]